MTNPPKPTAREWNILYDAVRGGDTFIHGPETGWVHVIERSYATRLEEENARLKVMHERLATERDRFENALKRIANHKKPPMLHNLYEGIAREALEGKTE